MISYAELVREALDFSGVRFCELRGYRFVTEPILRNPSFRFHIMVGPKKGVVKVAAFSSEKPADESNTFQKCVVPCFKDGERRVMNGLVVGLYTLRQPQSVEDVCLGLERAAQLLFGENFSIASLFAVDNQEEGTLNYTLAP